MATNFQQSVWRALTLIPKGQVTSYAAIADHLESKAVRAVGSAVGKNPDAPEVPCHRVVLASGKIGKYSGGDGVSTKIKLLSQEGVATKDGKIIDFENIFWGF
ncbi:MAG: MGMT family protein [Sulfurovum sp.]|nr:MGMT family protein [Sulfurovum sp.]